MIRAFLLSLLAAYTYTISMGDSEQAIYILTNAVAALAWITLGVLIHFTRVRYSPPMVRSWVYPLAISMKIFAGISASRFVMNNLAIYFPVAQTFQAVIYIANVMALAVAVGYASVYYKRIPIFLARLARHQALSRRFTVIADTAVDGFLETDQQGNIWYANRASAEILGMRNAEGEPDNKLVLGHNFIEDFMAGGTQEKYLADRGLFLATGQSSIVNRRQPTRIELKRNNGGGSFTAEITVSQYQVEAEQRFCIILRDITYKVELEENQKP